MSLNLTAKMRVTMTTLDDLFDDEGYIDALESAKKIVSAAMQLLYKDSPIMEGVESGWIFLNYLVREKEKEIYGEEPD